MDEFFDKVLKPHAIEWCEHAVFELLAHRDIGKLEDLLEIPICIGVFGDDEESLKHYGVYYTQTALDNDLAWHVRCRELDQETLSMFAMWDVT